VEDGLVAEGCLICEQRAARPPVALGPFRVYRCAGCGFRWVDRDDLDRVGSDASFQDYPHNAFLRRHFEAMKPLYRRGLQQRVARALPGADLAHCSFLDVGCANGEYLWAAQALGFGAVTGVEVDAVAARHARAFGPVGTDLDALVQASFDVVQVKNVVACLRDFRAFLMTCVALAKPGGAVFVDTPNEAGLAAALRRWRPGGRRRRSYGYLRPPHVINGFGKESLTRLVTQCGLTPTLCRAVWIGHPLAPYRPGAMDPMRVVGGLLPGAGALLILEGRRPVSAQAASPAASLGRPASAGREG
jgi:SAM-dependent methyltransferase